MLYVAEMGSVFETAEGADEIFRSDDVVVRRVAAGSGDAWVVTFDHYGIGAGFERPGFGEAYLAAQGISAIHVLGRGDDWYQYGDMPAALASVREATRGATRVLTYGSSMGAYAALRFADAVGATDVLALSPQYSIDPAVAPGEERWSQDIRRIQWLPEYNGPMACSARAVVIYDPMGPDRWHGQQIENDAAAHLVRLPYTSHPVTSFLSETGLLAPLIGDILAGEFDVRTFRREARTRRRVSGIYLGELASAQPERRTSTALDLAHRALEVSPRSHHARVSLARLLTREGRHDEAVSILGAVVSDSDRALPYVIDQGNALMMAGRLREARAIVDEVLARTSDVAHLHAWAAHVSWLDGDAGAARRQIRRAVLLDAGNAHYLRLAVDFHFGAPLKSGGSGLKVTPWLRVARWLMKHRFDTLQRAG